MDRARYALIVKERPRGTAAIRGDQRSIGAWGDGFCKMGRAKGSGVFLTAATEDWFLINESAADLEKAPDSFAFRLPAAVYAAARR